MTFTGVSEAIRAYENKEVELASRVNVRITEMVHNEDRVEGAPEFVPKITLYATTVGRSILSEILPPGLPFSVLNKPLKKKEISRLINTAFRKCGLRETVIFADQLMQIGFPSRNARRYFDLRRRHARAAAEGNHRRRRREEGEGIRPSVHVGSRHRAGTLQQRGRHLVGNVGSGRQGDDGAARDGAGGRSRRQRNEVRNRSTRST